MHCSGLLWDTGGVQWAKDPQAQRTNPLPLIDQLRIPDPDWPRQKGRRENEALVRPCFAAPLFPCGSSSLCFLLEQELDELLFQLFCLLRLFALQLILSLLLTVLTPLIASASQSINCPLPHRSTPSDNFSQPHITTSSFTTYGNSGRCPHPRP